MKDVGGGDVDGKRGSIQSVGDSRDGAKVGVVLLQQLRQVIQKIWVDVALWRKHNCEQLLFFGAVGLREEVAQKVMLRGQLATNIQRIPL